MAKKPIRDFIYSPYFTGYLELMPQEAKDQMKAEKPKVHEQLFENGNTITESQIESAITTDTSVGGGDAEQSGIGDSNPEPAAVN